MVLIIFNLDSTSESSFFVALVFPCEVLSSAAVLSHRLPVLFSSLRPLGNTCLSLHRWRLVVNAHPHPLNSQIPSNYTSIFLPYRNDLLFLKAHVVILNNLVTQIILVVC